MVFPLLIAVKGNNRGLTAEVISYRRVKWKNSSHEVIFVWNSNIHYLGARFAKIQNFRSVKIQNSKINTYINFACIILYNI